LGDLSGPLRACSGAIIATHVVDTVPDFKMQASCQDVAAPAAVTRCSGCKGFRVLESMTIRIEERGFGGHGLDVIVLYMTALTPNTVIKLGTWLMTYEREKSKLGKYAKVNFSAEYRPHTRELMKRHCYIHVL